MSGYRVLGEREIFLGRTAEGNRVWANVRLTTQGRDADVEFTDHSHGPEPVELGIMWSVAEPGRSVVLSEIADRRWISGGQTPAEDRVIVTPYAEQQTIEIIEQAWADWHLNGTNAACDHMTEEMLNPTAEILADYMARTIEFRGEWREKYSPAFYGEQDARQKWRLDNVECPVTGYRYGRSWLKKRLPEEVLAAVNALLGTAVAR